jgi:O-Antigen ligase
MNGMSLVRSDFTMSPAGATINRSAASSVEESRLFFALRLALAFMLVCMLLEAALPQLEMAIFSGATPIPDRAPRFLCLLLMLFIGYMQRTFNRVSLVPAALMVGVFLAGDTVFLYLDRSCTFGDVYHAYTLYYFILLLGGMASSLRLRVSPGILTAFVTAGFLISVSFAILQFATNDAILPTQSTDKSFAVDSWHFFGQVRAFGLFASPLNFGVFCCFIGALAVGWCRSLKGFLLGIPVLLLAAFGCYATYTRLTIIGFVACIASSMILSWRKLRPFAVWLPVVWLIVAVVAVSQLGSFGTQGDLGLGNSSSFVQRLSEWAWCWEAFLRASLPEKLFGLGLMPHSGSQAATTATNIAPVAIDNIYAALLVQVGLVGLVVIGFFCWQCWKYLLRRVAEVDSPLVIAVAATWATLTLLGMFNIVLNAMGCLLLLVSVVSPRETEAVETLAVRSEHLTANHR